MSEPAGKTENRGWHPGWPDLRGWAVIGFFLLTFFALHMIDKNPALLANASFMQFIQALSTGGILLVAANLFGGTKSGAEASEKLAAAYTGIAPAPPPAAPAAEPPAPAPTPPPSKDD